MEERTKILYTLDTTKSGASSAGTAPRSRMLVEEYAAASTRIFAFGFARLIWEA